MEDIWGYLLIGGFIAFTVLAEIRKKAKENASKEVVRQESTLSTSTKSMQTSTHRQVNCQKPANNNLMSAHDAQSTQSGSGLIDDARKMHLKDMTKSTPISDYHISSAEEVRRAIIWSEILRRKY